MHAKAAIIISIFQVLVLSVFNLAAQLSPGDLSAPHAYLEGLSNCTQCHVLGDKASNEKCLICHKEIQDRISLQKGYHSSTEVKGRDCSACHSEHNGKNFRLIRLDTTKFDHNLTGYPLSVPHAKKTCAGCHSKKFLTDTKLKDKKITYLGLGSECLSCHDDFHKNTLSSVCLNCHIPEAFKPASKFNHATAKFQLLGKHRNVDCIKCHKIELIEGKKFQEFRGVEFSNCTNCHKDPHKNQFGQACLKCHSEESFQIVKGMDKFDHNKTNYKLEEKHAGVNCKSCHKTKFTDPLKYAHCTDCHVDYHNGQFVKKSVSPDCSQCHSLKGFTSFSYTIEQHSASPFPLLGAHTAIPCFECHKKQEKWMFREIGINCNDCHKDIHQDYIQAKYYTGRDCKVCHTENRWSEVTFEHQKTDFSLTGAHKTQGCRSCHFKPDAKGIVVQKFKSLPMNCADCHTDRHFSQFEKNGTTNCTECHDTQNWKAPKFDHNTAAFKLDGKHINVPCAKCHKPTQEGAVIYVKYKLKEYKCESCHS